MFGRSRRPTTLERIAFIVLFITGFAHVAASWAIGTPGPEPGWTTYTHEGLTLSVPSSWKVERSKLFDHWNGIAASAPEGADLGLSVAVQPGDLWAMYEAADVEAFTIAERCPADLPFQGAAHVSLATVAGARGLMVEGRCDLGPNPRWQVTQLVTTGSGLRSRLYTIKLGMSDDLDAESARTLQLILDRLRF